MTEWFKSNAKRVADAITGARALVAIILPLVGWAYGVDGLLLAVWLMIADWTGDSIDGAIAHQSQPFYHTWLGDHDLEVDILVAVGLLGYLVNAGFVPLSWAGLYVLAWGFILWYWKMPRPLGMFCQAPVYGWFIVVAVLTLPAAGGWLLAWIIAAIIVTWPRFPQEIVPNFLTGMRRLLK